MELDPEKLKTVLVTDCGSTTTKALLFERKSEGWRQTFRGEAPTTVEEPVADVTVGALNAFNEVQELSGRQILSEAEDAKHPFVESAGSVGKGIDLYLSTSSAGGGLQMMVAGVVKSMSTESAQRAALGAGAIVMDAISADDGREDYQKIEHIRHIRPDIVLLTGGVDGGAKNHVIEMAEILLAASPRPRFGDTLQLPVIYAGNNTAAEEVQGILAKVAQTRIVENVRPTLERENLGPAREAIHELFLTHVMSHSPGYGKLLSWSPVPVMPTPAAVGDIVLSYSKRSGKQILCVDIGGATTDVFSTVKNAQDELIFNRTVSANLGMSYSVANVLVEAGPELISRWLNYELPASEVRDRLRNKMIRPTSIPQSKEDLWLEQAVCREALRLSLQHHCSLAVGLSGVQQRRGISDIFAQKVSRYSLIDMFKIDLVIGSGGVLSHAPNRLAAALMILDGMNLQGITQIAVDSIFMMPHLGVLASVHPQAAEEIFLHDCLINLCHAIVPVYPERSKVGDDLAEVWLDGNMIGKVKRGEVTLRELPEKSQFQIKIVPLGKNINLGAGPGKEIERQIESGQFGLIFDGRNRPINLPSQLWERVEMQNRIFEELGLAA